MVLLKLGRNGRSARLGSLTEATERGLLRGRGNQTTAALFMGRCTPGHHRRRATDRMARRCIILGLTSYSQRVIFQSAIKGVDMILTQSSFCSR